MKHEIYTQIANASTLLAVSTSGANKMGWFEFISSNAPGISVVIGFCSFVAAGIFYTISLFKQSQASKNEIEISHLNDRLDLYENRLIEILALLQTQGKSNEKTTRRNKTTKL